MYDVKPPIDMSIKPQKNTENKKYKKKVNRNKSRKITIIKLLITSGILLAGYGTINHITKEKDEEIITNEQDEEIITNEPGKDIILDLPISIDLSYGINSNVGNIDIEIKDEEEFSSEAFGDMTPEVIDDTVFTFDYEDRSSDERIGNANNYIEAFNKYAKAYGIDVNILQAIAAQENAGIHNIDNSDPAIGLMQIQKSVWKNKELSAYNFNTQSSETIKVNINDLSNLDYNIKVGAMILQTCLQDYNYNIPLAIQAYNMGYNNISTVLKTCASNNDLTVEDLINDPTNNIWKDYLHHIDVGDDNYINHVLSFLPDGIELVCKNKKNEDVSIIIDNQENTYYTNNGISR